MACTSENPVKKLSEKSWKYPYRGLTRVQMGTIRHRTPAKPVLGGLLKPLFRQFHENCLKSNSVVAREYIFVGKLPASGPRLPIS